MSIILKYFICIILFFDTFFSVNAQNNQPEELKYYLEHCEFLLQGSGKWKAANKDFNSTDECSPSYLGYEYTKGINTNTIHLKITGYLPEKSQWVVYWDGLYTWDHKKQKVIYQSVSKEGAIAVGETESVTGNEMILIFDVTSPGGKFEKYKNIEKFADGTVLSNSFKYTPNKWEPNNTRTWSRLEQPSGSLGFMTTRDGNFEVYTMDANGENLKNLTCNKAVDYAFSWFNDGRLLFYSNREGNDDIYIQEADGKKWTNISNHPAATCG